VNKSKLSKKERKNKRTSVTLNSSTENGSFGCLPFLEERLLSVAGVLCLLELTQFQTLYEFVSGSADGHQVPFGLGLSLKILKKKMLNLVTIKYQNSPLEQCFEYAYFHLKIIRNQCLLLL
jgi:hypothetical protein